MVHLHAERPARAALPFLVVALSGMVTLFLPPYSGVRYDIIGISALVVTALLVSVVLATPRTHWVAGVPPLAFFGVVAAVRDATGGDRSVLTLLLLLPVLWIVLYGTRVQLWLSAVAAAAVLIVPILLLGAPRYGSDGWRPALIWVLIIVLVCPTLQHAVELLRRSSAQYRDLAARLTAVLRAATEHAIIATDLDGTITLFSQGAERMLGYRAAEVVGTVNRSVLHDRAEVDHLAAALGVAPGFAVLVQEMDDHRASSRVWTYRRRDGTTLPVKLTTTAMLDEAGDHIGWMGVARDITAEELAHSELEVAERRWRTLLDHLPELSVLVVGGDLRYRLAVGAGLARQGFSDLAGKSVDETSNPANARLLGDLYRTALLGQEGSVEVRSSNTAAVTQVAATPLPPHNGAVEALVLARDVTQDRRRTAELQMTRDTFAQLFNETPHGALQCDVHGLVTRVNPALCELLQFPADQLVGASISASPLAELLGDMAIGDVLSGRMPRLTATRTVTPATDDNFQVTVTVVALRGIDGPVESLLITTVDVSERARFEKQLAHLAEHDPLTGLANRRKFDADLDAHLQRCRRYGAKGALLMLDLDNFKQINDTLGHGAGDQLIISVAAVLRQRLRTSDLVVRLGGDEFAVLLPEEDLAAAEVVAADLVQLIRNTVCVLDGSKPRTVTASIGVVPILDTDITPSQLVSTADMTMYDAKDAGRDRYVVHDTAEYATPRNGARIAWTARITEALETDRFAVHAQPVLDLATNKITGAELLIRMIDDDGQLILPGKFLYIAERTSLITDIDMFMLKHAAQLLEHLRDIAPGFTISVNLSGRSVGNPRIAALIPQLLVQHNIDPTRLILEITETAAVADIETARRFAAHIGALGCRFALDDFGAGFGSFYYLKHLTFDYVKIDGEFVAKSPSTPADQLIISSIVDIARGLGKRTTAEFVADGEILQLVTDLGVDLAQGFHIARPMPLPDLLTMIKTGVDPTAQTAAQKVPHPAS